MASPVDRGLGFLQRRGVHRGIYGGSRGWFWVAVITFGLRRLRKAIGSEYDVLYQGELKPGEVLQIGHRTETYEGKQVRSRRRRIVR
jgi:hypothetical protein